MFTWKLKFETKANANPQKIWKMWTDVPSWSQWNKEIEWSKLDGAFKNDTQGKIKTKNWPASTFFLKQVEEEKQFNSQSALPLTTMVFHYTVSSSHPDKAHIIQGVTVSGLFAPLLWLTMRKKLQKGIPQALNELAKLAESN